jgi:hypothetical protein
MGNTLGALRRSMVVMTVMVMVFQNNVLQSQVNTAGPGCGKQFVSELGPGYVWSEAANARCDDDETRAYAAPLVKGEFTQALKISNFGFALPADARVEGIEVVIIRKGDVAGAIIDKSVKLMKGNAVVGSDLHARDLWDDNWTAAYYGDENEDWDQPWTVREINSPGFGVAVSAMSAGAIARPQIDEVLVTVHFSYGVESARTHKASSSASRYTCNGWGS